MIFLAYGNIVLAGMNLILMVIMLMLGEYWQAALNGFATVFCGVVGSYILDSRR